MRNLKILCTEWKQNAPYQNVWDAAKAVIRGKVIVINTYFRIEERSQINNHTFHLQKLVKYEQIKPKAGRSKEIIKIRAGISGTENRKKNGENHWSQKLVFRIDQQNWPTLARLTNKKEKTIIKIGNERGDATIKLQILKGLYGKTVNKIMSINVTV